MAMKTDTDDAGKNIESLATLLESSNVKDQRKAIEALYPLTDDPKMIQIMIEKELNLAILRVLRPFKDESNEEDEVEGEEDMEDTSKPIQLPPDVVEELLMIFRKLLKDDSGMDGVNPSSFHRVINILKDDKYKKICECTIYDLLEAVCGLDPDVFDTMSETLDFKLPQNKEAIGPYLCLLSTVLAESPDAITIFDKISKSNLINEIQPFLKRDKKSSLLEICASYEVMWSLSNIYQMKKEQEEEDEDEDEDVDNNQQVDSKKKEEEDAFYKEHYEWITSHNKNFGEFMMECLSQQQNKNIVNGINEFIQDITNTINKKFDGDDKKENNKKQKKKKKSNAVIVNEDDIKKWGKMMNDLVDSLHAIIRGMLLYLKIIDEGDELLPKTNNEDEDEKRDVDDDDDEDEERKKKKNITLPTVNKSLCSVLIDYWMNKEFDIEKLTEINCVGIDFENLIDVAKLFKLDLIKFLSHLITDTKVKLSGSKYQSLWNYAVKYIDNENKQSKIKIEEKLKAKKEKEEQREEKKNDDNDGDQCNELHGYEDYDMDHNTESDMLNMLKFSLNEFSSELKVNKKDIDILLSTHSRIQNCQHRFYKHELSIPEDAMKPIDLTNVDDMNQYQRDLNDVFIKLFKVELITKDEETQKLILNALYDDVNELNKNIEFIDIVVEKHKNDKTNDASFGEMVENWQGDGCLLVGCDTLQMILDVMEVNEKIASLPINKKKCKDILKSYKISLQKWNKLKVESEKWNNELIEKYKEKQQQRAAKRKDKKKSNKKNKTNDENNESDSEDEDYDNIYIEGKIEWSDKEMIIKAFDECIANIEKFLE